MTIVIAVSRCDGQWPSESDLLFYIGHIPEFAGKRVDSAPPLIMQVEIGCMKTCVFRVNAEALHSEHFYYLVALSHERGAHKVSCDTFLKAEPDIQSVMEFLFSISGCVATHSFAMENGNQLIKFDCAAPAIIDSFARHERKRLRAV